MQVEVVKQFRITVRTNQIGDEGQEAYNEGEGIDADEDVDGDVDAEDYTMDHSFIVVASKEMNLVNVANYVEEFADKFNIESSDEIVSIELVNSDAESFAIKV